MCSPPVSFFGPSLREIKEGEGEGVDALSPFLLSLLNSGFLASWRYLRLCLDTLVAHLEFHVPLDLDVEPAVGVDGLERLLERGEGRVVVVVVIVAPAALEGLQPQVQLFRAVDLGE